jgi:hypothetical protein
LLDFQPGNLLRSGKRPGSAKSRPNAVKAGLSVTKLLNYCASKIDAREMQDKMTNQKPSFRSSCFEFATTLLIVAISACVVGYVVGSLGGSREAAVSGGAGAMMASLWLQKQRKARKVQRVS